MKKIIILIAMLCTFASAKCEETANFFDLRIYTCSAMKYEKTTVKDVIITVGIDYINVTKVKTDNTKKITVYRDTKTVDEYIADEFDVVSKTGSHNTEVSLSNVFLFLRDDYFYNE